MLNKQDVSEELRTKIQSVKSLTNKRENYFNKYFSFAFKGNQWTQAEYNELVAKGVDPVTLNNSEDYFEEYLSKLFPRDPNTGTLSIGVSAKDLVNREKYENKILEQYRENNFPSVLLEQGQNFLIGGAGCFYFPPDGFGGANIISVDPRFVYLEWSGRRLLWFAYYNEDTETYTYVDKDFIITLDKNFEIISDQTHKLGFIPVAWVPNMPQSHTMEGKTKIASIYDLDRSINKNFTNYNKRIDENTEPHRAVYSDNAKVKSIKRGKGKTTILPVGSKMEYLELKEGSEIQNYNEYLQEKIRAKTGLIDTGGAVKTAISGLSLSFQYSGMLSRIAFMRVYWDHAFRQLNEAILTYAFRSGNFETDPIYNESIAVDISQKVKDVIAQVEAGIMSRKDAIDTLRGSENSEQKLKEILDEEKKINDNKPKEQIKQDLIINKNKDGSKNS
jgi:hypothetical protein